MRDSRKVQSLSVCKRTAIKNSIVSRLYRDIKEYILDIDHLHASIQDVTKNFHRAQA